ncbi:hypothetical protein [Lysinibacillus fusiformis]|nr:hypothetical protein [Lysinibacillus fusiformis]
MIFHNRAQFSGSASHAEGQETVAQGGNSHAEGNNTVGFGIVSML